MAKLSTSTPKNQTRWRRFASALSCFFFSCVIVAFSALMRCFVRSPMLPMRSAASQVVSVVSRMNGRPVSARAA